MIINWRLLQIALVLLFQPLSDAAAQPDSNDGEESHAQIVGQAPPMDDSSSAAVILADSAEFISSQETKNAESLASESVMPKPMRAEYQAIYNGKRIGTATLELASAMAAEDVHQEGVHQFEIYYRMKATRGLASFVGANLKEEGRFQWSDNGLVPQYFKHYSKAFLSKTRWDARFDAATGEVSGEYKGDAYQHSYDASVRDPLTQFIDSGLRLARSASLSNEAVVSGSVDSESVGSEQESMSWNYTSVIKGQMRPYRFTAYQNQELTTECGVFQAQRVLRAREESPATQDMWFSEKSGWNLIRLKIVQRDGDILDLQLSALDVDGQHVCGEFILDEDS